MSWLPSPEYADWWYDLSWKGIISFGVITAIAALATVCFTVIQFWSDGVRDRRGEERTLVLETRASDANKEAARANEAAAKANERAATLEKEAAEARLQTEKLKQFVAWRALSVQQVDAIVGILLGKPDSVVNLRYIDGDPEAFTFAIQFTHVLAKAKWKVALGSWKPANAMAFGFFLPDANEAGLLLRQAFAAAGLGFSEEPLPTEGIGFNVSTAPGAPTLLVGSRVPVSP